MEVSEALVQQVLVERQCKQGTLWRMVACFHLPGGSHAAEIFIHAPISIHLEMFLIISTPGEEEGLHLMGRKSSINMPETFDYLSKTCSLHRPAEHQPASTDGCKLIFWLHTAVLFQPCAIWAEALLYNAVILSIHSAFALFCPIKQALPSALRTQ